MPINPNTNKIVFQARTWNKDSHGLFDYESDELKHFDSILDQNGVMVREEKNHEVKYLSMQEFEIEKYHHKDDESLLAMVTKVNGKFKLNCR